MRPIFVAIITLAFSIVLTNGLAQPGSSNVQVNPAEKTRVFLIRYTHYIDTAAMAETRAQALKGIEMVANTSKADWISQYHASYYNAITGAECGDSLKMSNYLKKAIAYQAAAGALAPKESEVLTLKAFLQLVSFTDSSSISTDHLQATIKLLEQSRKLNPDNPRTLTLLGRCYLLLPEKEGRDKKRAADLLKSALKKYETNQHIDQAWPVWGKSLAEKLFVRSTEK